MSDGFRDYIPEGEDLGAFSGGKGYQDYAPDPKPQEVEKVEKIDVVETPSETFKCDQCDFTSTVRVALVGHQRKHK